VAKAPVAIVVHPSLQVSSVADLAALAKRMPGQLNFGSAGAGTPGHLTGEIFKSAAGIDLQHVPYRGSAPAVTDLLGGQLQLMFDPLQSVLSNVQGGRLRAIAISSKTRASVLPNVPTIAESGYDGFETTAWWGVFAPANLPANMTEALGREIERIALGEAFRANLEPLSVLPTVLGGGAGRHELVLVTDPSSSVWHADRINREMSNMALQDKFPQARTTNSPQFRALRLHLSRWASPKSRSPQKTWRNIISVWNDFAV